MHAVIIYDHPLDYPDHFVVRVWDMDDSLSPRPVGALCGSLPEARAQARELAQPGAIMAQPMCFDVEAGGNCEVWL
jgi:hypothetical protein